MKDYKRLTDRDITKVCFDTWELCGLDDVCKRDCRKPEPCKIPQMILRLAELEDGIEHNRIAILPYNEGSFVNYGDEKAVICGYVIQNNQLYIQLDAYERPNEKYRCFWIEPDDEKLVVPKSEPRPLPDGMSRVKIEIFFPL